MIGRCTHVVDCREASGMGKGGSLAQRGTFAECGADVCAVAMSPGRRHITKPVCEITFGLREANVLTSTMVLNAGAGVPSDAPAAGGTLFGLTDKIKYGDSDLPDELIGMTDQYSKFDDHVNIINKDD